MKESEESKADRIVKKLTHGEDKLKQLDNPTKEHKKKFMMNVMFVEDNQIKILWMLEICRMIIRDINHAIMKIIQHVDVVEWKKTP